MISLFAQSLSPSVLSDWWYGPVRYPTAAGVSVTTDVAMTYSAVWACTRVLSASGSCLPLNMMRRDGKMTSIAADHPAHRLIHTEPNDEMGSMGMRSIGLMRQVNRGNFYAEIARDALGRPAKLWPLNNDRVKPYRASADMATRLRVPEMSLIWRIRQDDGTHEWIRDADMFNVRSIVSDNGIVGKGVIENARETIAHGIATVQQGAAYMKNSARPSVVITGGKFRDAEDRETYRRMWMDVHGGPENNAKPAMLPQDADLKVLSFSPEDSQFLQTLQHNVEDVARWYGVPPHMIQHLLRSTFNNIEHMGIEFVVYSLVPWLKMWEEEIQRKLLTRDEQDIYYAKHNVTGLLRGDAAARSAYYQAMWQLGAYSINEIRELEDMNPIDGGDAHFVQTSYATLDNILNPPEPTPQPLPVLPQQDENPLSAVVAQLLEYTKPVELPKAEQPASQPAADDRIQAIQTAARIMVEEAALRMASREAKALERASSKEPAAFFAWCDDFYSEHKTITADALSRPIGAYVTSLGTFADVVTICREVSETLTATAKDAVLAATEVQREEWPQINSKFAKLSNDWRATRSSQCIDLIHERVIACLSG